MLILNQNLQEEYPDIFDNEPDINFRNKLRSLEENGFINKKESGNETLRWYGENILENYIVFKDETKKKILPLDTDLETTSNDDTNSNRAITRGFLKELIDILINKCNLDNKSIENKLISNKIFSNFNTEVTYKNIKIGLNYSTKDLLKNIEKFINEFQDCLEKHISKIVYGGRVIYQSNDDKNYKKITIKEIIEEINKEVNISEKDLYNILISLETTNFLIFSGPSGVGKTLLVEKLSDILGGDYFKLPIKSDFVDETAIFGYWNPLLSKYEGTEVLKFLIKASKNPNIPYFLLLDEMNLSRIENYFSTFLSEVDNLRKGKSGKNIVLFETIIKTKDQYDNIKMFLESYFDGNFLNYIKSDFKFNDTDDLFDKERNFKHSTVKVFFKLPTNLKVIGTINEDETTYSISNKVLDRSQFITFSVVDDLFKSEDNDLDNDLQSKILKILSEKDEYPTIEEIKNTNLTEIKKIITDLQINIKKISINETIGYRTLQEIFNYISKYTGKELNNLDNNDENLLQALDYQIAQKILPKLSLSHNYQLNYW